MHLPPVAFYLSLSMTVYALIAAAGCDNGQGSTDAGTDAGPACGSGRFESFDWQCKSHVGCQPISAPGCGCRCARCNNEECVEQVCTPECASDAGIPSTDSALDSSHGDDFDVPDSAGDAGYYPDAPRFACDYSVDRDGSYVDADWDGGILIPLGKYGFCGVNDKYAFLADYIGDQVASSKVSFINLKDKSIFNYLTACTTEFDRFATKLLDDDNFYWNRTGPKGSDIYRLKLSDPVKPTRITYSDQFIRGASINSIVSGDIIFDGKGPETINYLNTLTGEVKSAQVNTEPFYGFLWNGLYVFSADYTDPVEKNCLAAYDFMNDLYSEYFCTDWMYLTSMGSNKAIYVDGRDSGKYGHPSSDIFIYDLVQRKEIRVTNDEGSQWCPAIFKNLVVYKDLSELGLSAPGPEGLGSLWVYDIDTGIRRKVPINPMDGCPQSLGDRYIAGFSSNDWISTAYLIDMVNAGVVKDGHVVPE